MSKSWSENSLIRSVAKHGAGRKVLAWLGPRYFETVVNGFKLVLDLQDRWGVSKYILRHGDYDREICEIVRSHLKENSVALDIGANIGFWSCFLSSTGKVRKIYSIEPEPHNSSLFKNNIAINGYQDRVEFFHSAVGKEKGALDLFISADNAGDHQLYDGGSGRSKVRVPVHRVDDLVSEAVVDFIKMDVQGYEPFVVEGMTKLLDRSPDVFVLLEYWPSGMKKAGGDPHAMLKVFEDRGFNFHYFDEASQTLRPTRVSEVDAMVPEGHHVDMILSRRF